MIQILEVEAAVAEKFGLGHCYRAWEVWEGGKLVLTGGVVKKTLAGEAELWVVPQGEWSIKALKVFKWGVWELRGMFGKLVAHVDPEKDRDKRFAEFYGFKRVGEDFDGKGKVWLRYET